MGWLGDALGTWASAGLNKTVLPALSGDKPSGPGQQYMGNPDLSQYGANPNSSYLKGMVTSLPQIDRVGPVSYTGGSYTAKDMSKTDLPQYDAMRERLNSQYSQQQGQAQDSIDRQFAASGGGPGNGAQAKQTENLAAATEKQKSNDLLDIGAQEAATRTQLQQQEAQKEFQSGESAKGYGFQAELASNQNQQFNTQMQAQRDQYQQQFGFSAASTIAGLDLNWQQAQAEANNNAFNKELSQYQAQHSGGILGGGGFLGSGIGIGFN